MAVKMRKWSPWPPATRKFQVAVKPMKLEGLIKDDDDERNQKSVAIKIKWKGEPKFFPLMAPFQSRRKMEISSHKIVNKKSEIIEWDDDQDKWFENTCCFSVVSDQRFGAWEVAFNVLYGEKMDSKAAVIGRVSTNISEIASKLENSSAEQKLHLSLRFDGLSREATLTVLCNFVELREPQQSAALCRTKSSHVKTLYGDDQHKIEKVKSRRRSLSLEEVNLDDSDEPTEAKAAAAPTAKSVLDSSNKKEGWFSWTSRRFSFKRAKTKEADPQCTVLSSVDSINDHAMQNDDPTKPCIGSEYLDNTTGDWEEKELISRDGQAKLKASVFLASFDQRSNKAAGESACTALVAVISHWFHSNTHAIPDRSQFNSLVLQGSSEWRKLCENTDYVNEFPNKHFDLETVLRADIRPISISHNKSFVGFFGAEKFESLKGAMSFDDIWDDISSVDDSSPRIYIVSWNDHFFVLKAEADAYYIIDTLGERLFEGCNQAYILRFDDKAIIHKQADKGEAKTESENIKEEKEGEEEIICSGKECCREFIKRFLAAIPLKELEEEKKKEAVSCFSLHQRLQIEFNFSCSSSAPSSLSSSPLSSLTTSGSSPFSD